MTRHYTVHAADRVAERYGFIPTGDEWERAALDIIEVVGHGGVKALLLRRFHDGTELWLARLSGCPVKLVYRPKDALFITALPGSG